MQPEAFCDIHHLGIFVAGSEGLGVGRFAVCVYSNSDYTCAIRVGAGSGSDRCRRPDRNVGKADV